MKELNTIIEQWHERIGPLQQQAVKTRATYLGVQAQIDSLKPSANAPSGLAGLAKGYLQQAFTLAIRRPLLAYKKDLAQLAMQRDQFRLDSFITETTAQITAEIMPELHKIAPAQAEAITKLQTALEAGFKARNTSDVAAISCAQASGTMQWANTTYYFNALQRSQNAERDLRQAQAARQAFNAALSEIVPAAVQFDDISNINFSKFGPEFSRSNGEKFSQAGRRLNAERTEMSASLNDLKTELLGHLSGAANKLGVRSKGFDSLLTAAHQRIKPPGPTIAGAAPKADF